MAVLPGVAMTWELCRDLSALHERYRDIEKRLEKAIEAEGLPLRVWEAKRSSLRQKGLYARGRRVDPATGQWYVHVPDKVVTGTPVWSPHIYGLAVDRILVVGHPYWVGEAPTGPWDTGTERDEAGKQRIVRHNVFQVWVKFGRMANSMGVKWGGQFQRAGQDFTLIGWDPYHTEHREWRKVAISIRGERGGGGDV